MGDVWNLSYCRPWTIPNIIPIIWSFLNIYKNKSINDYFISKLNYFTSFLITTSFIFPTHDQHGYEKTN
jgi:hypothetical protein